MSTKRILAFVLALSMIFSLIMPGYAFADTGETIEESTTVEEAVADTVPEAEAIDEEPAEEPAKDLDEEILEEEDAETFGEVETVCMIGSVNYPSLSAALLDAAAMTGEVAIVMVNPTQDSEKTFTVTSKVTIMDTTTGQDNHQLTGDIIIDGGELTLKNITLNGDIHVRNSGKIIVNEGSNVIARNDGKVIADDSTATGEIKDGKYSSVDPQLLALGYEFKNGEVVKTDAEAAIVNNNIPTYYSKLNAAVTAAAGTKTIIILKSGLAYTMPGAGKLILDESTFAVNVTTPAAPEYKTTDVGGDTAKRIITVTQNVASVEDTGFSTFAAALTASGKTKPITLYQNVSYELGDGDKVIITKATANKFSPSAPEGSFVNSEDDGDNITYTLKAYNAKVVRDGETTYFKYISGDNADSALKDANLNGGVAYDLAGNKGNDYTMTPQSELYVVWKNENHTTVEPAAGAVLNEETDSAGVTHYWQTGAVAKFNDDLYDTVDDAVKAAVADGGSDYSTGNYWIVMLADAAYTMDPDVAGQIWVNENGFKLEVSAPDGYVVTKATVEGTNRVSYYLTKIWTVTFKPENGEDSYDREVVGGETINIYTADLIPSKPGYTFFAWADEDGNTVVAAQGTFAVQKDREFTAQWTQNEYRIVIMNTSEDLAALLSDADFENVNWASDTDVQAFIEDSGLAATNYPHLTYGQVVDGPEQLIPEKPGNKHVGYATMVEGIWWDYKDIEAHADPFLFPYTVTDVEKPVGTENGLDKVLFVFGTFEEIDYTVTLNGNGGTFADGEETKVVGNLKYEENINIYADGMIPSRPGYTFFAYVDEDGSTVPAEAGTFPVQADRTFTARWTQNEYRIVIMNTAKDLAELLNKEGFADVDWASDTDVEEFLTGDGLAATNLPHLTYGQVVNAPVALAPTQAGYKHVGYAYMVEDIWTDYKDIEAHSEAVEFPYTVTDVEKPVGTKNGLDKVLFVFGTFEAESYTVTLNGNGGIFADDKETKVLENFKYNDKIDIYAKGMTPSRPGYTFFAYTDEDGNTVPAAGAFSVLADRTFTAQWTQDNYNIMLFNQKTDAVKYLTSTDSATPTDLVAGSIPNVHYGDLIQAPEEFLPKVAGKTLVGYAVIYDAFWKNGATPAVPEVMTADIEFPFPMPVPNNLSNIKPEGAPEGIDYVKTLYIYGVYEDDLFTVTFDANGGAFADGEAVKVTENLKWNEKVDVPLDKNAPVRTGYKFMGWLNEQGNPLAETTTQITVKADRSFTANWKAVPYTVLVFTDKAAVEEYLATDTDLMPEATSIAVNIGDTVEAPETVPVVPGKTLVGFAVVTDAFWKVGADQKPEVKSDEIEFPFEMFVPYELDRKLFPQAAKNTLYVFGVYEEDLYNVNFDANGGVFADGEATKTVENFKYKDKINIYDEELIPTRTGYSFYAYTDENGKTILAEDGSITVRKDRFFTAQWTQDVYSIKLFNDKDAAAEYLSSATPTDLVAANIPAVHYGDTIEAPVEFVPTAEGKTLVGYAAVTGAFWRDNDDNPELKSADIEFPFEMMVPYDLTEINKNPYLGAKTLVIYGVFDTDLFTVTFDANGGAFADGDEIKDIENVEYGTSSTKLAIPADPVRVGYTFKGWENEDGEIFLPLPEFQVKADRTFTAHWTQDAYRVVILNSQEDFKDLIKLIINAFAREEIPTQDEIQKLINDFIAVNLMPAHLGDTVNEPATFKPSLPGGTFTGYEKITGFTWATVNMETVGTATDLSVDFELSTEPIEFSFEMPVPPEIFTLKLLEGILDISTDASDSPIPSEDELAQFQPILDFINKFMFICGTFEMNEYTVTFDANGGAFADGTDEIVVTGKHYNDRVPIPAVDPVLVGYSFDGWYAEDGKPIGPSVLVFGDRVATAKWTQDVYSIKLFNDKDAAAEYLSSATPTDLVAANIPAVHYGDTIEAPVEFVPTAEGKTLVGYAAVTGAFWRDNDNNPELKSADIEFPFEMFVPYDLTEINKNPDLGAKTLVIYGVFDTDLFTVTFDANGGAFVDGDEIKDIENVPYGTMSSTLDIPANPVRLGYTFTGWENEDGEVFLPLPDFAIKADRTFKANWKADVYNIKIFEDKAAAAAFLSGTGSYQGYNISEVHIGDTIEAPQTVPTKEGATLVGYEVVTGAFWNALVPATDDEPSSYAPEIKFVGIEFPFEMFVPYDLSKINKNGDLGANTLVIYGVWDIDEHTVVFDADGGTFTGSDTRTYNAVANNNVEYGSKIVYPTADPVRPGYAFQNWEYDNGLFCTTAALPSTAKKDMVYTAQWKLNKYAIEYANDLNQAGNPTVFSVEDLPISFANPGVDGYIFDGWTSETLNVTEPTLEFTIPEGTAKDIKVAENWTLINYNINYALGQGGWAEGEEVPTTYNVTTPTFTIPTPVRDGYDFAGWLGAPVLPLIPQQVVTVNQGSTGNITLYATWSIQDRTLTVEPNNGENATVRSYNYGTSIRSLEEPVWEGHTFTGWYTMVIVDGQDTKWVPTAFPFDLDYDTVIHATWSTNAYTITFDPNGGEFAENYNPVVELYYGSEIESYIPNMEKPEVSKSWPVGYDFAGWTLEDGSAIPETMPAQNLTAVANWTPHVFTVTYKSGSAYEEGKSGIISPDTGFYTKNYTFDVPFGDPIPAVEVYYPEHSLTWVEAKYGYNAPDTMPAEDLTFVASWEGIDYTLHLDANGGTMLNYHEDEVGELFLVGSVDDTLTEANGDVPVDEPTRLGYEFHGWENEAGTHFDHDELFKDDMFPAYDTVNLKKGPAMATYTALWDAVEYTVIFKIDDEDYDEGNGATIFDEELGYPVKGVSFTLHAGDPIVPPEVTWEGHNLQHWTWKNLDGKTSYVLPETMPALEKKDGAYPVLKFTAMFEGNRYLIAFDANGGLTKDEYGNDTDALLLIAQVDQQISEVIESGIVEPVRTGYVFKAWENRDGKQFASDEFEATDKFPMPNPGLLGITFYTAVWTANKYAVVFKSGDNDAKIVDPATGTEKTELSYVLETDTAVPYPENIYRPGHTFKRWALVGTDDVVTSYVLPTTVTTDLTFVAEWTINEYTVTLDANGGIFQSKIDHDVPTLTLTGAYGTSIKDAYEAAILDAMIEPTGFDFSHWEDSLGNDYANLTAIGGFQKDETYTAIWKINSHDVVFNADGGTLLDPATGLPATDGRLVVKDVVYGSAIPFPADPTKTGYSFKGWIEVTKGLGYGYDSIMPDYDLGFKAEWEINTYTITIDPNGGEYNLAIEHTGLTEPLTFTTKYNYNVWVASGIQGAITREGYTFSHWEDTKGNEIASLDGYPATGDETYTAIWKINTNSVTYTMSHDLFEENKKDGVATMGIVDPKTGYLVETVVFPSVEYGAEIPSVEVVYADHSYTWVEKTYGLNLPTIMPDEDLTFTAVFEGDQYILHFDANGGTLKNYHNDDVEELFLIGSVDDVIYTVNGNHVVNPVRPGYTFHAWVDRFGDHHEASEFNTETAKFPAPNGSLILPFVTTFTAMWTADEHEVTFDADGGVMADPVTGYDTGAYMIKLASDAEIPYPEVAKTGYTFVAWKETAVPYGYNVPTTVPAVNGLKLYFVAEWQINEYTVTLDANGGIFPTKIDHNAQKVTLTGAYGTSIKTAYEAISDGEMIAPTGFTFSHWEDSEGKDYASLSAIGGFQKDETYTAIWNVKSFNVAFNAMSGTIEHPVSGERVADYTVNGVNYGDEIVYPADPVRPGYVFDCWKTNTLNLGFNVPATMPDLGNDGDTLHIYATWNADEYTLTFDANGGSIFDKLGAEYAIYEFTAPYGTDLLGLIGDYLVADAAGNIAFRTGYTLTAWLDEIGNPYQIQTGDGMPIGGLYLTAQWTENEYTVAFDMNGGTFVNPFTDRDHDTTDPDGQTPQWDFSYKLHYGEEITFPEVSKTGYEFKGWVNYVTGYNYETTMPDGDTYFYATWDADTRIYIYDADGGEFADPNGDLTDIFYVVGETGEDAFYPGKGVPDKENIPFRAGYQFNGWYDELGDKYTTRELHDFNPMGAEDKIFTADWTPYNYTVAFNSDGGKLINPNTGLVEDDGYYEQQVEFDTQIPFPANPTKNGYTFLGWEEVTEKLGLNYPTFMPNKDLGFKARWQVNEITFTFNANGGQVADKLGDLHDSIEISGNFNTTPAWYPGYPVATGYTFAGWFDVENQENLTEVHPFDKDRTLEARWEINKFYVIYDLNDYESVIHPITGVEMTKDFSIRLAYGAEVPYPAATKVGYTFQGWMEKVDGFNLPETMPNRDITLTAVWNDNYYVVSFNGNGGVMDTHGIAADGSPNHIDTVPGYFVIGKYAETIDNPIQGTLYRPGYEFHGWVDDSTPLAEHYDDGMLPGTFTANVNYTALWDVKSYNVKYQAGGGKVISLVTGTPVDEFTLTGINYGETIPVPEVPVLTGYTFKGWYETNVGYGLNCPETMPALEEAGATTLVFVAQWEINEYTITFDGNGGLLKTTALDNGEHVDWTGYYQISGQYGASTATMLPMDASRAGYAFHGFVDQDGKHYDLTDRYLPANFDAKDMYFVAIWGAQDQTVEFDPKGGTVINPMTLVPTTKTITLTLPTDSAVPYPDAPTKTGYTFAGWREAKLGFTYPETVPAGGLTFYAEWTADENTVTYDANGGLVKDSYGNPVSAFDITAATDAEIYYPPEAPARVGYTFLGWDNTKGQRIAWTEVPATMPAGGEYYTAAWQLNPHTITYKPNGGTAINPVKLTEETDKFEIKVHYGDPIELPFIYRDGYTFGGWVETTYGLNTPATVPDADLSFKAKWNGIDYTVTFDGNGGIILTKGMDMYPGTSFHRDYTESYTVVGTPDDVLPKPIEVPYVVPSIDRDPSAVRYGYAFHGWIDQNGKHYANADLPTNFPASDMVYTAEWEPGIFTLTFDANGGEVVDPETGKTSGRYFANLPFEAAISYPVDPVRTGYTFKGWEERVIGYNYPEKMPGYNLYYTAQWAALPDTVTYDANGGTILNKAGIAVPYFSVEAKVDAAIYAPNAQLPVREGYDFLYWIDSKENHYNAGTLPGKMPAGGEVYTAMWEAHEYNLYFNPGQKTYGTAKVEDPTNGEYYAKEIALKLKMGDEIVYPGVVYPGYDFLGWTSEQVLGTPTTMPGKDVLFTANWKAIRYTITYDMGGGYIPTGYYNPDTYTMDDGAITLVNPVHEGYTFTGWTGSNLNVPTTVVTIPAGTTGDLSYTATWKVNTYVVTFKPWGGTVINPITGVPTEDNISINVNYGEPVPYAEVSRPGYELKGWCDSILGFVLPATMPAQNLELTAVWNGLDISVTFDGNGGRIPTKGLDGIITSDHGDLVPSYTVVGKIGDKVVRPYADPTRAGYDFHGWVDEAGKHYDRADIPTQFSDVDKVYTAQWKALPHTVSFDANYGTVVNPATGVPTTAIYSIQVNTGDTIPYPETPTRTGFTFYGWQEVNLELGFSHPEFMPADDLKFVAIWTPVANTVTYDANGGTVLNKAQYAVPYFTIEAKTGDSIYRPTEKPVRYGYDFEGWYDSDDNYVKIADLAQYMPVTGETYVAHWKGHKVDVVFYKTPYDVNSDIRYRQMYTYVGDTVKVPLEPVISGYDFGGWYYFEKDADGKFIRYIDQYDLDAPVTVDATILLVGMWSLGTYDVTYNANGGLVKDPSLYDVASFTITNQYGKEIYAPADSPVRVGYDFAGWYNSQNVRVKKANLPTTMPAGGDVFTAHWQVKNFTMTFDGNGGYWTVNEAATDTIVKTQTFGSALTAPVAPTNPGHVFDGWTPAVPSTVPGENMTFTAKWKTIAYTVTFDSNGGTDVDPQTVEYGQLATEPKNGTDLFKKGYNLLGWFELQENGTLAAVKFDFTKPVTRNMTLVAKWEGFPAVIHWMDGNVILRRDALHIGDLIIRPETVDYSILQRGKDGYRLDPEHLWTPEVPDYVEESMVFMLNWIKQIDVFFNVDGKIVKHIQVDEGSTLDENPDVPVVTKDGYKLVWFVDGFEFPNNRPIGNCDTLSLTATWVPVTGHTVSFDPANGTPVFTVSVEDGKPVSKPNDPVKEGYNFTGWFDGDDEFDFTEPVTDDLNLVAKYEEKVLPSASYTYRLILGDSTDILYSVNNITAGTNPEDYTIEYTYKGVTNVDTLTDAEHNEFIIAKCAAKEMTEPVHVVVRYQGEVIKDASYTCRGYSEFVISSPAYELHLKNLVKAMLDFGTYAQTYFGYNVTDLANRGTNYYDVPSIVVPARSNTKTGSATGISSISYSLIVDSRTTLNVSFNHEVGANVADYVFTVDGKAATAVDNGTAFVVYIDGIIARDLGVDHVVNVTNVTDGTTLSFTSAPVNYMYAAQSVAGLGNLMKAMYNYSQYASGALL